MLVIKHCLKNGTKMVTSKTLLALAVALCWMTVATKGDTAASGNGTTPAANGTSANSTGTNTTTAPSSVNKTNATVQPTNTPKATTTVFRQYNCSAGTCSGKFDCVTNKTVKLTPCLVNAPAGGCNVVINNGIVTLGCTPNCTTASKSATSWCCKTANCNITPPTTKAKNAASQLTPKTMIYAIGFVILAAMTSPKL